MEAIVLAGGFGTRLRGVLPDLPKPMALINGRPFLDILLTDLAKKGFTHVVLSLGFMAEKIRGYFGNAFQGMAIDYVVEMMPLGTGGGVRLAMDACWDDHCFIFNGDTFIDLDVDAVERHWVQRRNPIIVGRAVQDTTRYGRLLIEAGRVTGIVEKGLGGAGLINAGCYVFNYGQLNGYAPGQAFSLERDYLAHQVEASVFDVFITQGYFIDIGVPEDYARAQLELPLHQT